MVSTRDRPPRGRCAWHGLVRNAVDAPADQLHVPVAKSGVPSGGVRTSEDVRGRLTIGCLGGLLLPTRSRLGSRLALPSVSGSRHRPTSRSSGHPDRLHKVRIEADGVVLRDMYFSPMR